MYFKNIPDDILTYLFEYYIIGLRHRLNLRNMKQLIEFTQGKPNMILTHFWSDVELVMQQANVSRARAVEALDTNEGDIVMAIMDLLIA